MSGLRLLSPAELAGLAPRLREVVEYRKSGLSLDHVAGCRLDDRFQGVWWRVVSRWHAKGVQDRR